MVLLAAAARHARDVVGAVATFDHGTGEAASRAAELVVSATRALGLPVEHGRAAASPASTEAEWRTARRAFLAPVAARLDAIVATAHTRDDQLETVLMRVMRGSGARGMAALAARPPESVPLLGVRREEVASWAAAHDVAWIEDPTNCSSRYFRNRVRHELLPALLAARPELGEELLDIACRAAEVRRVLEGVAARFVTRDTMGTLSVDTSSLADYDPEALRALWPAIAATGGIVLDRRGTVALARFTKESRAGQRLQLSGPVEVVRRRAAIVLSTASREAAAPTRLGGATDWGGWRFRRREAARAMAKDDAWMAILPANAPLTLRGWRAGDRMQAEGDAAPRRVKRFLRDAGLVGPEREGWPVVLAGEEIVWIPGVRRSAAAAVRPGRPGDLYVCERESG